MNREIHTRYRRPRHLRLVCIGTTFGTVSTVGRKGVVAVHFRLAPKTRAQRVNHPCAVGGEYPLRVVRPRGDNGFLPHVPLHYVGK